MLHTEDLLGQYANRWALDAVSEDGSIFGDADDDQVEPNSARGSREQSPSSSVFSDSGSDEVGTSSQTSGPRKFNAADDNSAQSTNSLSPVPHDGLFDPEQIENYYGKKQKNCESICLFICRPSQ